MTKSLNFNKNHFHSVSIKRQFWIFFKTKENYFHQDREGEVKCSEGEEIADETLINNIDLGGILNLATEDTLNIRSDSLQIFRFCLYFRIKPNNLFFNYLISRELFWNIHYVWSLPVKILLIIGMTLLHFIKLKLLNQSVHLNVRQFFTKVHFSQS